VVILIHRIITYCTCIQGLFHIYCAISYIMAVYRRGWSCLSCFKHINVIFDVWKCWF